MLERESRSQPEPEREQGVTRHLFRGVSLGDEDGISQEKRKESYLHISFEQMAEKVAPVLTEEHPVPDPLF